MDRLGVAYQAIAPSYVEAPMPGSAPDVVTSHHALEKALSVAREHPDAYVIGSDQVAYFEGEALGKPGTPERARAQLRRLSGREHVLVTSVALVRLSDGHTRTHVDQTTIGIRPLDDAEIARYVERDDPSDCTGSYKSEGLGVTLLDHQTGRDPSAVVGLPLMAVASMLREVGFDVP